MNLLILDTSCDSLTIALKKGEKFFGYKSSEARKGHSTLLLPAINGLLQNAELKINDIDYFGVVLGPGSFTGVRIGVATVNAFGYATGKSVVGVTAFEPFTYNNCDDVLYAIDAKHAYYTAKKEGNSLKYETVENGVLSENAELLDVNSVTPEMLMRVLEEKIKNNECAQVVQPFYMRASEAERNLNNENR